MVAKSGYLSKKGRQNPKYSRYWFTLKGDVLSYYSDPSDLYFPSGNIDLRYGISATLTNPKEKGKDATSLTITTHHRIYYFKADSATSAKEWVKTLQKVIFRSHNDGDSVKISLPIENIIDIEESPVIDFAETFKVRVVDSDETFALDEYFFSFFSFGKDALDVLRALVEDTPAQRMSLDLLSPTGHPASGRGTPLKECQSPIESTTPVLRDSVRNTLSPVLQSASSRASPRVSGEWSRKSIDVHRISTDVGREPNQATFDYHKSMDDRGRRSASTGRMSFRSDFLFFVRGRNH